MASVFGETPLRYGGTRRFPAPAAILGGVFVVTLLDYGEVAGSKAKTPLAEYTDEDRREHS